MNRLARNLVFPLKNWHKPRSFASFVCPTTIENRGIVKLFEKWPVQSKLFEKIHRNNVFAIQKLHSSSVTISQLDYENFCVETLDGLSDYFEDLMEMSPELTDVVNADGVLTVNLGLTHGTYVINKQSPNKQIWLSSPISGPKRFDFAYADDDNNEKGYWIYKHTGETLHELLDDEFTQLTKIKTAFQSLPFGSR